MSASKPISVVIRTSNSEGVLRRLLARLPLGPGDEVIVVDTASSDGTVAVAEAAGARVIRNTVPFNYSRTLNLGFEAARHDWILALSSHCVPIVEDLLGQYRTTLAMCEEMPAAISGTNMLSRKQYLAQGPTNRISTFVRAKTPWSGNSNCLYHRAAWARHRFDESMPTGEDLEWREWAIREGLRCLWALAPAVLYHHAGSAIYRFRKGCAEVRVRAPNVNPMSVRELVLSLAQATRRLLWDERSVSSWLGQIGHQLGVFVTGRAYR